MRIGAHLSISKGLVTAGQDTRAIGGDTFGFHTRNPRGGAARQIGEDEIGAWREFQAETGLTGPVGHLPYVVNLGSDRDIWEFGVRVVGEDLVRCHAFGAEAIVLHPGHAAAGTERGRVLERVADGVRRALAQAGEERCTLLLEGMAGQTGEIGATPEELGAIIELCGRPEGLGVCLDSCHLFAAGWDIRTATGVAAMLAAYSAACGRERIGALHLNDSKFGLGSHRDRHERIGRGEFGADGLGALLRDPFIATLPIIIETPVDPPKLYAEEIAAARALAAGEDETCAG